MSSIPTLNIPERILMGPGPSGAHPLVLQAMARPLLGHLDPDFLRIMDEVRTMLRQVLQTGNEWTLVTPGTGTSGMETAVMNLVEPGDKVVVGICGYFGDRIAQMAARAGGEVIRVEAEWGTPVDPARMEQAITEAGNVKLVALVHAETSTGIQQPVEEIAAIARQHGALFLVDCVTSLGGVPVNADAWGADAVYSGTQKCLSAPPGVAPVTFSERASEIIRSRETPVNTWYLDMALLEAYWDDRRSYHHTAPISMIYAVHQALTIVLNEGLENRWVRHERNGRALQAGLEAMGVDLLGDANHRLPVVTLVGIPDGVDDAAARKRLLEQFGIEVGGGLGQFRGRAWRVGLMGESSTEGNVLRFLSSIGRILRDEGIKVDIRAGIETASARLSA